MLSVSIVVCCYNSESLIGDALLSLAAQKFSKEISWEVLILDNNSRDDTVQKAIGIWEEIGRNVPLRVINESKQGAGFARYRALEEAECDIVSFVDDDARVAPDWVQTLSESFMHSEKIGAIGGENSALSDGKLPYWFDRYSYAYAVGKQGEGFEDVTEKRGYLWGAGLSIRKSAWETAKKRLADQQFFCSGRVGGKVAGGGEDSEICFLLILASFKLFYQEKLKLGHYLPEKRLSWDHLCSLHQGFGSSDAIILAYRSAIGFERKGLGILLNNWLGQTSASLFRLSYFQTLIFFQRLFKGKEFIKEDNRYIIEKIVFLYRFLSLISNRSSYIRIFRAK